MVLRRPFHCPVKLVDGQSFEYATGEIVAGRSWALITSKSWQRGGIERRLRETCGSPQATLGEVTPNPTVPDVVSLARGLPEVEVVVALGGGSVMDAAKGMVALNGMSNDESTLLDHLQNGMPLPASMTCTPLVVIPTTSGTGSEVTPWGTIWGNDGIKFSVSDPRLYPTHAVLDATLCRTMSHELTLATGLDALSHAMESVWNRRHTPLVDALATQAIGLVRATLESAIREPDNPVARKRMQTAAVLAGLAMGTTQTALAHSISYPFTAKFGIPHGLACSFTLAQICRFNAEADAERLVPIAAGMGCPLNKLPDELERWLTSLGVGEILGTFVSAEQIDRLGDNLINRARAANNIPDVDGKTARRLAHAALLSLNQ